MYGGKDEDGAAEQVHNDVPFGPASQVAQTLLHVQGHGHGARLWSTQLWYYLKL